MWALPPHQWLGLDPAGLGGPQQHPFDCIHQAYPRSGMWHGSHLECGMVHAWARLPHGGAATIRHTSTAPQRPPPLLGVPSLCTAARGSSYQVGATTPLVESPTRPVRLRPPTQTGGCKAGGSRLVPQGRQPPMHRAAPVARRFSTHNSPPSHPRGFRTAALLAPSRCAKGSATGSCPDPMQPPCRVTCC